MAKIQSGYGGLGGRDSGKKGLYGGRSSGKNRLGAGGFGGQPTIDFVKLDEDDWNRIFPNSYRPSWMKDDSEE
jgi:hypothetical protein